MIIAIAGPYSADNTTDRMRNLNRLNTAAARLLEMGHTPIIGVNAALPVLEMSMIDEPYESIMKISMAVISACEGLLLIGESPGALRERDWMIANGRPVFHSIDELKAIN